jgi:hypothetical protein
MSYAGEQGHRIACGETSSWWEQRYHDHGNWHGLRPDAALEDVTDTQRLRFSRGMGPGTDDGRGAAVKLQSYAHSTCSHEWARELRPLPALLVVTPDPG